MLGSLRTSLMQIWQENQVIFPNYKQNSITANEISTPGKFHKHLKTLLPSDFYLHVNMSSLSYRIDYLKSLIISCQVKPKTNDISECGPKKKLDVIWNIINNYRIFKRQSYDLKICKLKEIESIFIGIIEAK